MRMPGCMDALVPASCLLCGAPVRGPLDLCPGCAVELPWLAPGCRRCALPLPGGPAPCCGACLRHAPRFAACTAAFVYGFPVRELILRFKLHGDLAAGRLLAHLLAQRVADPPPAREGLTLVPMPLHPRRLRARGFNQAERIARVLSTQLGLTLDQSIVRRALDTRDQKQLGAAARRANLHHAFEAARCPGRRLVIVDDVLTTGASADSLAAALLAAGAAEVRVWCLARVL